VKKTGAILLLLLLFYTQWGHYAQFVLLQWRMREAARETWVAALPDTAFLRVSLADMNAGGKWEEAGKECWYKGHLYDVIRTKTGKGTTILFCMDDEREERLIRQSGEVTRANQGQDQDHGNPKTGHSLPFSIGDLVCEGADWYIRPIPNLPRRYATGGYNCLPTLYTEIVLPPPKG